MKKNNVPKEVEPVKNIKDIAWIKQYFLGKNKEEFIMKNNVSTKKCVVNLLELRGTRDHKDIKFKQHQVGRINRENGYLQILWYDDKKRTQKAISNDVEAAYQILKQNIMFDKYLAFRVMNSEVIDQNLMFPLGLGNKLLEFIAAHIHGYKSIDIVLYS